ARGRDRPSPPAARSVRVVLGPPALRELSPRGFRARDRAHGGVDLRFAARSGDHSLPAHAQPAFSVMESRRPLRFGGLVGRGAFVAIAALGALALCAAPACSGHQPTDLFEQPLGSVDSGFADAADDGRISVCPAGGITEVEPNDEPGMATPFTMTVCG